MCWKNELRSARHLPGRAPVVGGSGLALRTWETLSASEQGHIRCLYALMSYDWDGQWRAGGVDTWWNALCQHTTATAGIQLDMKLLIPGDIDVAINGYNGKLLDGVCSGFNENVCLYGTKWPFGHDLTVIAAGDDFLKVDFDTPWSQPLPDVLEALSQRCGVTVEHWYAESGSDVCGRALYYGGRQTGERMAAWSGVKRTRPASLR